MSAGDEIFRFLNQMIIYGGSGAAAAYLIFQFLGKNWIESKFAQKLDELRHAQALELQHLRVEIDSMLSAAIKIQDKEFETLAEAWHKLNEAYEHVVHLVSPLQRYPDLDRMTVSKLKEFLASSELRKSDKQELLQSENKSNVYKETIFWYFLPKVSSAISDLHNYVERNSIFLPPDLKQHFEKASKELWSAMVDKEVGHQAKNYKMQNEGWTKIKNEVEPLRKTIEAAIYTRLRPK